MPRIALSVDMLETGVNIPEVVNLVFMRPVQSRIKLDQMVGRGTRTNEACRLFHLLPNGHKEGFLIIDFWENDFKKAPETEIAQSLPVLVSIFNTRLKLLEQFKSDQNLEECKRVIQDLRAMIDLIPLDSFSVKKELPMIEHVWDDGFWRYITGHELEFLKNRVGPLLRYAPAVDVQAMTFTSKVERLKLQIVSGKDPSATAVSVAEDVDRLPEFVFEDDACKEPAELCLSPALKSASVEELNHVIDALASHMKKRKRVEDTFRTLDLQDLIESRGWIILQEREEPVYYEEYRRLVNQRVLDIVSGHPTIEALERGEPVSDEQLIELERTLRTELGDGDLDLVAGNAMQANRLYLNNGTADPFNGVAGGDISSDAHNTWSTALGDVDGDGDLDLVVGNEAQANRLYLNNGTIDPFSGVAGGDISSDAHDTWSIALGDMDGDGDLDLAAGNSAQANRLYLNNGTADPFSGVTGSDISSDAHDTWPIALGDVDGDGDLDLVAGNYNLTNRLYLNNGTSTPFSGVTGSNISSDTHLTFSIALGDVDGDGDLDLVVGNDGQTNRLYLNNGTSIPFLGVSGLDISSDAHYTHSVALGDMDRDGDLDLVVGNDTQTNRLYLNNGTSFPFLGVAGLNISSDVHVSRSIALGDMDGDSDLDLVVGNFNQTNRLYLNNGTYLSPNHYHTAHGLGTSLRVDTESSNITQATLTASADLPINTKVTYYLSNNGGVRWYIVQSGVEFTFPSTGMDLRWKAELESLSPILTPRVNQIQIEVEDYHQIYLPLILR